MAIEINRPKHTVAAPDVSISGKKVNEDNGLAEDTSSTYDYTTPKIVNAGTRVYNRKDDVFFEVIDVTITPDHHFIAEDYSSEARSLNVKPYNEVTTSTNVVVGKRPADGSPSGLAGDTKNFPYVYSVGTDVNERSNTYYTLNGKNPTRTKSTLYTAPFKIRTNSSGTDNIIFKARTYVQGQASEVTTIHLRIIKKVATEI